MGRAARSPRRALIGLPLHPDRRPGEPPRWSVNSSYGAAIEAGGGVPVPIPPSRDGELAFSLLDRCDGLCLPGGPDVSPELYGEAPLDGSVLDADVELDRWELALLDRALTRGRPLLAICRGAQLLNVALGGTLWQDIPTQLPSALPHRHPDARSAIGHTVELEADTELHRIAGSARIEVNSLHHQGIRRLAPPLRSIGRSPDGLIEAVDLPGARFTLGLQAHPEELIAGQGWAARLFTALVDAAASDRPLA